MFFKDPVCCKIPGARTYCNYSCCCISVAKFGFSFFDKHRKYVFFSLAALSVIALIFASVSVASLSLSTSVVKDTYWTYGTADGFEVYVGINKVVTSTGNFNWKNVDCDETFADSQYCNDCKSGANGIASSIIINFITLIPTITSNLKRSTPQGDLNCTKFFTILTGLFSTFTMLAALSEYSNLCYKNLPTEGPNGEEIVYKLGPGFVCLLIPQIIKPFEVLINILTPVPLSTPDKAASEIVPNV
mmetsp:Transcript_3339/g.3306  ORF Transcript_3339/g.3306 Transcript_3339/m.3306 type:complete len:245 (+) Transcript_3339:42-776(+)